MPEVVQFKSRAERKVDLLVALIASFSDDDLSPSGRRFLARLVARHEKSGS